MFLLLMSGGVRAATSESPPPDRNYESPTEEVRLDLAGAEFVDNLQELEGLYAVGTVHLLRELGQ